MPKESTEEYRNNITLHLMRISGDIEHIKEKVVDINNHLVRLNGRVTETEKQVSWIKGIGGAIVFAIGVVLTWIGIEK
jgi:hypothetical protein